MARVFKFRWRLVLPVALIVVPLLFLEFVGLYFLRQDKLLVETDAREKASELGRMLLGDFTRKAFEFSAPETYTNVVPWSRNELFFEVDSNQNLLFPPPILSNSVNPPVLETLSGAQSNLWRRAEEAEYIEANESQAIALWQKFAEGNGSDPAHSIAQFNAAILLQKLGRTKEAQLQYEKLRDLPPTVTFQSGLPIAHLAEIKLAENGWPSGNESSRIAKRLLLEPTQFSQFLLHQLPQPQESWIKEVETDYANARELFAAWRSGSNLLTNDLAMSFETHFIIQSNGSNWWVLRKNTAFFARSEFAALSIYSNLVAEARVPDYASVALSREGRLFAGEGNHKSSKLLASITTPESNSPPGVRLDLFLAKPELLYARQKQRARWLGGFLALATVVALIGIVQSTRSILKQEQLNQLKSNFVSSVSHELRAPIASMRLMAESLESGRIRDPEKQQQYYQYLVQECRRLSWLVENVLNFSRIEQERKIYEFESVNLIPVVQSAINPIQAMAAERDIKIEFSAPDHPDSFIAIADPFALQQALINLLDNALKHSPSGAVISVKVESSDSGFKISIKDSGPGIPKSEHGRIFERFYRLGSELRRETPGVGIGLSIVKHIVEAHSGHVSVDSEPGQGATFVISFPGL